VPVSTNASGEKSKPKERVEVQSIKIVPADSIKDEPTDKEKK